MRLIPEPKGIIPRTLFQHVSVAAGSTAYSSPIVEPWNRGRGLLCSFMIGSMSSGQTATLRLEGRSRATGAWDGIIGRTGSTVEIPSSRVSFGGDGPGGMISGSIPLDRIDANEVDAIRWRFERNASAGATSIVGVAMIAGIYSSELMEEVIDDLAGQLEDTPETAPIDAPPSSPAPPAPTNPVPSVTGISPTFAALGAGNTSVTVFGGAIVAGCQANFGGVLLDADSSTASSVTVTVPSWILAIHTAGQVYLVNPSPGGGQSTTSATFEIRAPVPTIGSLAPSAVVAGGGSFTLTVTGIGFLPSTTISIDGQTVSTTYVNPTTVQAVVSPLAIVRPGGKSVTVSTPGPGGGSSTAATLTVDPEPSSTTDFPFEIKNQSSRPIVASVEGVTLAFSKAENRLDTTGLRVVDGAGIPVAAQFQVLTRWDGLVTDTAKAIRFLRVYFAATVGAGTPSAPGVATYTLQAGAGLQPAAGDVTIQDQGSSYRVTTSGAEWVVPKASFGPFTSVSSGGFAPVTSSAAPTFAMLSGTPAPSSITTTIEEQGTCRVVLRKAGSIGATKFVMRLVFTSGSRRCRLRFRWHNPTKWGSVSENLNDTNGTEYVSHASIRIPLVSSGSLAVASANGLFTASTAAPYKCIARVRPLAHQSESVQEIVGDSVTARLDYVASYEESLGAASTVRNDARYEGGWRVIGSAGGVGIAATSFWEAAPRSVEVDGTGITLGLFAQNGGWPSFDQRDLYSAPWLQGAAGCIPAGNNPYTTPPRPWQAGDYAPPEFPDGGVPPSGSCGAPAPSAQVRPNARTHHRFMAGMALEWDFEIEFFSPGAAMSEVDVANLASYTRARPFLRDTQARFSGTKAIGPWLLGQDFSAASDLDIRKCWRWVRMLFDDSAADLVSGERMGYPRKRRRGMRVGQQVQPIYGWARFGCDNWDAGLTMNHYVPEFWMIWAAQISGDCRGLYWARASATWSRDIGRIQSDDPTENHSGCMHYEHGFVPGLGSLNPDQGHNWVSSTALLWIQDGDYAARESLLYAIHFLTRLGNSRSPVSWDAYYGDRVPGLALEALVWIYCTVGNVPGEVEVIGQPAPSILDVMQRGVDRWIEHETGARDAGWGRPANRVLAANMITGVQTDFFSQGFVMGEPQGPATDSNTEAIVVKPWMSTMVFKAMLAVAMIDPAYDRAAPRYAPWFACFTRVRNWLRSVAILGAGQLPQVWDHWRPDNVIVAQLSSPPGITRTVTGNVLNVIRIADAMALASIFFAGTPSEIVTAGDTDADRAEKIVRGFVRYHQADYNVPPSGGFRLQAPTDPAVYDQISGSDNPSAAMTPTSLTWFNAGQALVAKFMGAHVSGMVAWVEMRRQKGQSL